MTNFAQIHRFGDCVALYIGKGETIYITPDDARKFAKQLYGCAKDIEQNKYLDGVFRTKEFKFNNTGFNGTEYKHKRKEFKEGVFK